MALDPGRLRLDSLIMHRMTLGLNGLARRLEEAQQGAQKIRQCCQESEALHDTISTLHDRITR